MGSATPSVSVSTTSSATASNTSSASASTTPSTGTRTECSTWSGESCVFPFKYKGHVYRACTVVTQYANLTPWCATQVDSKGNLVGFKWGFCNSDCPGVTSSPTSTTTPSVTSSTISSAIATSPPSATASTTPSATSSNISSASVSTAPSTGTKAKCSTWSGESCVFPFKYKGRVFRACTMVSQYVNFMPWCPTQVDSEGNIVDYKWGYCNSDCPGVSPSPASTTTPSVTSSTIPSAIASTTPSTSAGSNCTVVTYGLPCVFPFIYNGYVHRACITTPIDPIPQCPTKVNQHDLHGRYWGYCNSNCPG